MGYSRSKKGQKKAYVTIALGIANVLIFAILTWGGMTEDSEYMMQHGALYAPYVLVMKKYYLLFTSMFLHFGFEHLVGNMVCLFAVGWDVELAIGRWRYILIYIGSGLVANIAYVYWCIYTDTLNHVSAGASGAIFGILGALMYLTYKFHNKNSVITSRGVTFMILMMLFYGFTSDGVNNVAHVAGLVSGFVISALLTIGWKKKI